MLQQRAAPGSALKAYTHSMLQAQGRPTQCARSCSTRAASRHHSRRCVATPASSSGSACVVVGGGIGGLVTAAKLAQSGRFSSVTLLEQGSTLGGRCTTVQHGEFRFDTGPTLLLLPDVYRQTFEWLGAQLEDHVQLRRVEPAAYRVHFPDAGGSLELLYDVQEMVTQLERVEAGAGTAYLEWLAEARKMLVLGSANFIARDFASLAEFLDLRRLLPLLGQLSLPELLGSHHSRLARRFRDPRIRALLSFQDLYVGLSPYTSPGVFSLLAATEVTDGVWYPAGGFSKVVDGLVAVCKQYGVGIRTNTPVASIRSSGGAVTGVQLQDGSLLPATTVVTNRDVSMSYPLCVNEPRTQAKAQQLAAKQFSAGVVAFYWSVNNRFDGLAHHNVFLSGEYEASWRRACAPEEFVRRPNFYLCAPSRTDPTAAPAGQDSVMVLLPVSNMQERGGNADYDSLIAAGRQRVLDTLGDSVGLQQSDILRETVRAPPGWRQLYGLEHGAAFGLSHGLDQLAILRPGCVDADAPRGLFFVGASSRPGNGIPLVMLGAQQTAERILRAG